MWNKGYTLLETVIVLFLMSVIISASALAINALGLVTTAGIDDISYRRNINEFVDDMNNGVSSLLSTQDQSYSGIISSGSGIVMNDIGSMDEGEPLSGEKKLYKTKDLTMYLKGNRQKRNICIESGYLKMKDEKLNKEKFNEGEIEWEIAEEYSPIKITAEQFLPNVTDKTEFEITTTKENNLSSIKVKILVPTTKGANKSFNVIFTCEQEVLVSVKT